MPIEHDEGNAADYEDDRLIRQMQEQEFQHSQAEHHRKKSEELVAEEMEREKQTALE